MTRYAHFGVILALSWGHALANEGRFHPLFVDLYCNSENTANIILVLRDDDKSLWIKEETFKACQIPFDPATSIQYHDELFYPLKEIQGVTYLYDPHDLSLNILVPSTLMRTQDIALTPPEFIPNRPLLSGAYMNYDFSTQKSDISSHINVAALPEFVYFNHAGVGATQFLIQNQENLHSLVRLRTHWTLDQPEDLTTWRFGDSFTGSVIWSGVVQFGGIQYARNFGTQPGFVPFPLPHFSGNAIVPTTVDFYLNNQLRQSQQVRNGVFDFQNLPVITGSGNIVMQSTDILGRQTVSVLPYYVSQQLLRPGLTSFSYEAGFIRENFGIDSNDYGSGILVGSFQQGLLDNWTLGWHGECQSDQQTFGLNSFSILAKWIQIDSGASASHTPDGLGVLTLLGFQRQTPLYSFGARFIATSDKYRQLGLADNAKPAQSTLQSHLSLTQPWGTLTLTYTQRLGRTEEDIALTNFSYSKNLLKNIFVLLNALHQSGITHANSWFLSFIWSPKPSYTSQLSYEKSPTQEGAEVSFSKNLPPGPGYGYRILGATGSPSRLEADYALNTDYGFYRALYSHLSGANNYELDASGSVIHFTQKWLLSRKIDSGFILVEVPDFPDVRVYKSNQLMGRTDARGILFIPQALPYDHNIVSLEAADLPLNAVIEGEALNATPYYRSGSYIKFPVYLGYPITFTLVNPEEVIPPGSEIMMEGIGKTIVGYEGKVAINEPKYPEWLRGQVFYHGKSCSFSTPNLAPPPRMFPQLDLGIIPCLEN